MYGGQQQNVRKVADTGSGPNTHLLGWSPQLFSLGDSGFDSLVLDQLGGHCLQHRESVRTFPPQLPEMDAVPAATVARFRIGQNPRQ
jgi:hypothetical protein